MFWEVGLLVTTLAAAISTSIGDEPPQGGNGIDATGAIIKKTDPFGGLDANGVIINETELQTISDEDMDFYNDNSIGEGKVYKHTTSCKRAGGSCIKRRAKCNGTVDKKKCEKKRKCCIPEVCKHANSCTRAGGNCIKGRAKCDGTVDPKGCKGGKKCKCCMPVTSKTTSSTTTAPTTPHKGSTVAPCPSYNTNVTNEKFVMIPHKRGKDWHQARKTCQKRCGTDLYEPKNSQALAEHLELQQEHERNFQYWVGARGNGRSQVWFSGVRVPRSAPWYDFGYLRFGGQYCMQIMTQKGRAARGEVFAPVLCSDTGDNTGILCG